MNDEKLGQCADHGGDWGLSCGFWAKYANLADEHIRRVHLNDPTPLEVLQRNGIANDLYYESDHWSDPFPPSKRLSPEEFHPDPIVAELRKRPMVITTLTNLFAIVALWTVSLGLVVVGASVLVWFVHELWVYFGG